MCLSVQRGEMWFSPGFGTRIADYYEAFRSSPWLERLLKLEVIRQAAIPYWDEMQKRAYTPLLCVEHVLGLEVLTEAPVQGRLPIKVDLDIKGVGCWAREIDIFMPRKTMNDDG